MQLDPIVPDETLQEATDAEPITFQIVGHRRDKKGKVTEEAWDFTASPDAPYGPFVDFLVQAGEPGSIGRALNYIEASLLNDEERERLHELLHAPDMRLHPRLIDKLATQLVEAYTQRPTSPQAGSSSGPARAARRSAGGAGSRGSAASSNGQRG
jgi:hypothetical protein